MSENNLGENSILAAKLLGSLLEFTRVFYKILNGRDFVISQPEGRESHHITIAKALTKVFRLETNRLLINVPPGHGKSTMLSYFVAWAMAHYPDCNFIYVSYSAELAASHTYTIKQIMTLPQYRALFGVEISKDSAAKDDFRTTVGGRVYAAGAAGTIVGVNAGLPETNRFSGGVIIDDAHKIDEVHSDTQRERVLTNFEETIAQRPRGPNVPMIFIGQRVHEGDLAQYLKDGRDGYNWQTIILPALDELENALYPSVNPKEILLIKREKNPYVFASQFQQDPQPAGGGIFRPEWFVILDEDPKIEATFITADTAETSKSYNDATVFCFWGIYRIHEMGVDTDIWGLHWIDCREMRVEPKDLEPQFRQFYSECLRHPNLPKPTIAAIEKKSTGATLISVLDTFRGLRIMDVDRNAKTGNKTERFLATQPYVASKRVSFTKQKSHVEMCIEHCRKITANNTHRFDDICFAAGTRIATPFGYKNIENMQVGDSVITPYGIRKVTSAQMTNGAADVIEYRGLIGTPSHPIFSEIAFVPMGKLDKSFPLNFLSLSELIKWKYKLLLSSMESHIASWEGRNGIILANQKTIKNEKVLKDCMLRFGNFITERKYQKAILFIIKTTIILIITLATWSVFRMSNIYKSMLKKGEVVLQQMKNWLIWRESENLQKNGMQVKKVENGTVKILKNVMTKFFMLGLKFVSNVIKPLMPKKKELSFAQVPVQPEIDEGQRQTSHRHASFAELSLLLSRSFLRREIDQLVAQNAEGICQQAVYNITVEDAGVYYANNILVSNCDNLADAVKLALIDEIVPRGTLGFISDRDQIVKEIFNHHENLARLRRKTYEYNRQKISG